MARPTNPARSEQFARAVLRQMHPGRAPSHIDVQLVALGMRMYAGQEASLSRAGATNAEPQTPKAAERPARLLVTRVTARLDHTTDL